VPCYLFLLDWPRIVKRKSKKRNSTSQIYSKIWNFVQIPIFVFFSFFFGSVRRMRLFPSSCGFLFFPYYSSSMSVSYWYRAWPNLFPFHLGATGNRGDAEYFIPSPDNSRTMRGKLLRWRLDNNNVSLRKYGALDTFLRANDGKKLLRYHSKISKPFGSWT